MQIKEVASQVMLVVALLCGVTATGIMVRREFFPGSRPGSSDATPVTIKDWAKYAAAGHRMGPVDAPVTIIEFADFECPVCKVFTLGALKAILEKYPTEVAVVFRHWPLEYHRFAYPTARAAECAGAQGRFEQFHDLAYQHQDSLGLKSYESFARESGVADIRAFEECNRSSDPVPSIEADAKAAKDIGGRGTPTIVINGQRLAGAPDSASFERFVRDAIAAAKAGSS